MTTNNVITLSIMLFSYYVMVNGRSIDDYALKHGLRFVMKEVDIKNGKAGASSHSKERPPSNAFVSNHQKPWLSGDNDTFPVMIWYQFNRSVSPSEITFQTFDRYRLVRNTIYQFIGSHYAECNEKSTWVTLCHNDDARYDARGFTQFCRTLPAKRDETPPSYRCLGIRNYGISNSHEPVGIKNIRIWEQ